MVTSSVSVLTLVSSQALQYFVGFFPSQVFVSANKSTSARDVDNFFNFADMQMGL